MMANTKKTKFYAFILLIFMICFSSCPNTMLSPIENFIAKHGINSSYSYSVLFSFDGKEDAVKYMIYESETNDPKTSRMIIDSVSNTDLSYSYSRSGGYGGKTFYYWARYSDGKNISSYSSVSSVTI